MVLSECRIGEKARVTALLLGESRRKRIMDLGLMPGTEVQVVRKAPLGDPIVVQVRGYQVSFRMSEARYIEISDL
ncbi:iron transporter FeoA [Collibacillus ludicampi]|uniref:Iron transporter FeoA n=1 Tax=Collibacillus ludicampi TaxID=2771369 RepID=A0AAV4LEF2_9BACL|nr:FeoA family protein [Collibacillus ludicampi]GIM46191.1 iron transporter FeoA [Collibacillus ludicampi]